MQVKIHGIKFKVRLSRLFLSQHNLHRKGRILHLEEYQGVTLLTQEIQLLAIILRTRKVMVVEKTQIDCKNTLIHLLEPQLLIERKFTKDKTLLKNPQ